MKDFIEIVQKLYESFNRRDIPAVLSYLHADVAWANGMEGGHVHGHDAICEYWRRQWAAVQPNVDPVRIDVRSGGEIAVEVHQVVRDLGGGVLLDGTVRHVFRFRDGLIARFDIEDISDPSSSSR